MLRSFCVYLINGIWLGHITILLIFIFPACTSQTENKSIKDDQESDSVWVKNIVEKSKEYARTDIDSLDLLADRLLSFYKEKGYLRAFIDGQVMKARHFSIKDETDKAINVYLVLLDSLDNLSPRDRANIFNNLGNCHLKLSEYDLALEAQLNGLKMEEKLEDQRGIAISYLNIAGVYAHLGNTDKSEEYAEKSYRSALENNFPVVKMQSAYQLAEIYVKARKDSLALLYADTTIRYGERLRSSFGVFKGKSIQATVYLNQGKFRESLELERQIGEYYNELGYKLEYLRVRNREVHLLIQLEQYQEAELIAHSNLELAQSIQAKDEIGLAYEKLGAIQNQLGKNKSAYENARKFIALKEELEGKEKKQIVAELETKYETEKKETEIASLSQQAIIQTLELEQKNLTILIGSVLVLLIAGFVFFANRQKTLKSQQNQMELEQRFLRSQLNPHFISNALLAVQNFMLKNQSDLAVTYLSKFSKLMRETLENSRREFILLEDELAMLTNFMDVHKMRLNDSFDYEVHISDLIDPEVDTIPPMFVQPFVENAIEHGIAPAGGKGKIELYFEKEGEYISIVIKDNGGGYTQSSSEVKDHVSLSTTIIQERMAVFNKTLKKKISLVLANVENEKGQVLGAKVDLKVPFRYV
ncbi:histidine kinase [Reichenbachiella carrageenanivorans]|uniref:Histidine kinase n=1 Tax=Reichenbachiella carrageenanivorans TaxID=2979869 RepID=A0ABY6D7Y9_9BACT|nr:histidine kinase [Reichenbachiella carrageenanivorans]UXX79970.1 histidine kinase [Reichenbachiella carrageenanivorans]